jgi:hypothetical protein
LFCLFIEFHAVIQFSPVDSWALKAKITDNGTFYYIWKPICSNSLRIGNICPLLWSASFFIECQTQISPLGSIGDLVTTVDYQSSSGTPPTNLLHCVHDLRGQVSPASTFTVQGTFTNTLTNNSWEIVRGSTSTHLIHLFENIFFGRKKTNNPKLCVWWEMCSVRSSHCRTICSSKNNHTDSSFPCTHSRRSHSFSLNPSFPCKCNK